MKLTTDQIIARHGLLVQAGAAPQNGWIIGAEEKPLRYFRTYDRGQAVALYCERYGFKTEDTTIEELACKHGISLSVDMFGIWTATTPSGFHSFRCDTAKEAVEMAAAQAERDAEHKAQNEAARAKAEANAAGFEKGGYVTQKPGASFEQAPAPAKKPAEIIEDAKDRARKAITRGIEATMARYHEATGEHITEVCPLIRTLNLPGSDGVMAKRRSALDSVRLSTG